MRHVRELMLALAVSALAAGCGDKPLVLDQATVDDRLDRLEEMVPNCESPDVATPTRAMRTAARQMQKLSEGARLLGKASGRLPPLLPMAGVGSSGSCGGTLDVTFEHGHGDTDYVLDFSGFCMSSDDGDIVLNGTVKGFEDGTPSDLGPVADSLEVSTDGPLEVVAEGNTMQVTLEGARTEYGNPAAGSPGAPDDENPNVTTVREASVVYVDFDEREDYIHDLRVERTGGTTATVRILDGVLGTRGEGRVDIRTPEGDPLVINLLGPTVTSGTIELQGADDTVMTLQPGAEPGMIDLTLNGAPFDRMADCSSARTPLVESVAAIFLALPIY